MKKGTLAFFHPVGKDMISRIMSRELCPLVSHGTPVETPGGGWVTSSGLKRPCFGKKKKKRKTKLNTGRYLPCACFRTVPQVCFSIAVGANNEQMGS